MQNQVNMNQVSMNVETSSTTNQPQFIIQGIPAIQGGVVNLAELLNKANAGTNTGNGLRDPVPVQVLSTSHTAVFVFQGTQKKQWPPALWTPTSSTLLW